MLDQSKTYQYHLADQVAEDIDERTVNGVYVYFLAWALIGAGTGFYNLKPVFFWSVLAILIIASIFRLISQRYLRINQHLSKYRTVLQFVNVVIPISVYSTIFSLTIYSPEYEPIFLYVLMVVFALLSAGSSIFAPLKSLSLTYIIVLTVPPLLAALLSESNKVLEAMMLALFGCYMVMQAGRLNREYMTLITQQYQLQQLNQQDGLTGIANRRCFDESLLKCWKTLSRTRTHLTLILVDIDKFKEVNDCHGHAAGDDVIIRVANILKATCQRETDLVARIGGEEFAVLITTDKFEKVLVTAERIRSEVEKTHFEADGQGFNVTVSMGIVNTMPDMNKTTTELYKMADRCLYRAKENGRNRIEYDSGDVAAIAS